MTPSLDNFDDLCRLCGEPIDDSIDHAACLGALAMPGLCEQTTIGHPAPTHLPAPTYPEYCGPDERTPEYMRDLAAAVARDPWPVLSDSELVAALARHLLVTEELLHDEYKHSDGQSTTIAAAEVQAQLARLVSHRALLELETAHKELETLRLQIRTERSRLEREVNSHQQTIERLTASVLGGVTLQRKLDQAEALRVAALQDLEQMRQVAIRDSGLLAVARRTIAVLETDNACLLRNVLGRPSQVFDVSDVDTVVVEPVQPRTVTPSRVAVEAGGS